MKLYLVRHGEAKSAMDDPARSLTDKGQDAIERLSVWAARSGIQVDQIWHSGKRRAEQTAEILAKHLLPSDGVLTVSGLAPNDDVQPVADILRHESGRLMLVGHLPFLSSLASALLIGDPDRHLLRFETGGTVYLLREGTQWSVIWIVYPRLVP